MEKINICFTSPSKNVYSETFIQNLKKSIDGNIFNCFGFFPVESEDGELKNPSSAPLIIKALYKLGLIRIPLRELYLESYLKRKRIQLIIANYGPSGAELSEISERLGISLIVHFHGYDASVEKVIQNYIVGYHTMFKIAKAIVVVSSEMRQKVIRLGADEKKVVLLRCSPSKLFNDINPDYQSNQVLAIGRFVEKKAPYLTLLAFKKAQEICPNLRIKFVGEGDLLSVCKDISESLKIDNVEFAGVLSPLSIAKEMAESFCFVQHSKTAANGDKEGTPVAILEAMAAGLPVISTYHAGIPDVITSDQNGILVQEGDVDEMAQAIVNLYKDRDLAEYLGENGKKYAMANLTKEQYNLQWNSLIRQIVLGV
ncbi:glycosyltransferase family 4 protein [Algoriphagus terrigena]|uniref:glycosyltransferase family 4 protein n=1 Tax=Algoriphagus terrigena TaxID=344884 RepID=UPI000684DBF8|nr:glycosyltransferase family 4 protein [Algoriphagus terrigena]